MRTLRTQVAHDPLGHACVAAQRQPHGVASEFALDVEVAASRLVAGRVEEVPVVEQRKIHSVERIERAVEVGVVAPAGGGDVAHDLFVFDAPQGDQGQGHRVDHGSRVADFTRVTLCGPMQTAFGRVVCVVVEKRRDGVVNPVHVVESDSYGALPVRVAIKN